MHHLNQLHTAPSLNRFGAFFVSTEIYFFTIAPSFPYGMSQPPRCRSPPPPFDFSPQPQKSKWRKFKMATINLRNFYPWYTHDEFIEVSDELAQELFADKRYAQTHERTQRRNKVLSLDAADNTEAAAMACNNDNPETIFTMMYKHCRLCCALNSLPETQGKRIEAYYLLGKTQAEIAQAQGVTESAINKSIQKGLQNMKIFLKNFNEGGCFST